MHKIGGPWEVEAPELEGMHWGEREVLEASHPARACDISKPRELKRMVFQGWVGWLPAEGRVHIDLSALPGVAY